MNAQKWHSFDCRYPERRSPSAKSDRTLSFTSFQSAFCVRALSADKLASLMPVAGRPIIVVVMSLCHVVALLAFIPYFFSWTGVVLAIAGAIVSVLGINICYHRLLARGGLSCSKRVEHLMAMMGVLAYQFGPAYWVAIHRRHHHYTDCLQDPHGPGKSFFWSHMGWLFAASDNTDSAAITERYAKDLLKDPFYVWLENEGTWGFFVPLTLVVYFVAGLVAALLAGGSLGDAAQIGSSLVIWGGAVRIVVVWHATFAVNSVCHTWGYRNHATPDDSRNNPVVALLAFGEGWHNNHHALPQSARHGHRWWELDLNWLMIRALAWAGLVKIWLPARAASARLTGSSSRKIWDPSELEDMNQSGFPKAGFLDPSAAANQVRLNSQMPFTIGALAAFEVAE